MSVSSNGTPVIFAQTASNTPSQTATWPNSGTAPAAGHLIVAVVWATTNSTSAALGATPTGWTLVRSVTESVEVVVGYYAKVATGSDSAPVFKATLGGTAADATFGGTVYDLSDSSGNTPVLCCDGSATGTSAGTLTITTDFSDAFTDLVPTSGCLGIAAMACGVTSVSTTWTTPANWTLGVDQTTGAFGQGWTAFTTNGTVLTAGSTASCAPIHSRASTFEAGIILVVKPPSAVPMNTFYDAMQGSSVSALWNENIPSGSSITEGSGFLSLTLPVVASGGNFTSVSATTGYNLIGCGVCVKLVNAPSEANFATLFQMAPPFNAGGFGPGWEVTGGNIQPFYYTANYTYTAVVGSVSYSSATYQWLMIDNFGLTNINWRYSGDGVNWTTAGTLSATTAVNDLIFLTDMFIILEASTGTSLATSTSAEFAFLNTPPHLATGPGLNQTIKRASLY